MNHPEWLPHDVRAAGIERALKSGELLFRSGQRTVGLYEIVSGRVRLIRVDRSGRESVLYSAEAGDTFAEASLFSPVYHCDAVAATAAKVLLFPKAAIVAALARDPKLARAFIARLAHQVMDLRTRLARRNMHSARDRIRHFLAVHAGGDGRTVVLTGTLKELAANLGLTHEALYRTLSRMAAEGEIKRLDGKIRLLR